MLVQACRLAHLSVCPVGELWKNGRLDLDAVWSGEWGQSRMGVLDGGGDRRRGRGSFGGKRGASRCNQWGFCGVVILCREGWRRGSFQITLDNL